MERNSGKRNGNELKRKTFERIPGRGLQSLCQKILCVRTLKGNPGKTKKKFTEILMLESQEEARKIPEEIPRETPFFSNPRWDLGNIQWSMKGRGRHPGKYS